MAVKKEKLLALVRQVIAILAADRVTVYAAQSSFFCIISAVPFLSLFLSLAGLLIPANLSSSLEPFPLPEQMRAFAGIVLQDIKSARSVPLLSASAIAALWTASKGTSAVHAGLQTVYRAQSRHGFVMRRLSSLFNTLLFLALLLALILALLFGNILADWLPFPHVKEVLLSLRYPAAFVCMCGLFCIVYARIARRSSFMPPHLRCHLPGAVFSAVGWVLFSFFYSLYVTYFPNAASLYGSLAAVCLLMLWVYFCLLILLLGAELNKLWALFRWHLSFSGEV